MRIQVATSLVSLDHIKNRILWIHRSVLKGITHKLRLQTSEITNALYNWLSSLWSYPRHSKSNVRKSNSIELNPWIEFDWVRQSNEIEHHTFSEFDFRTNRIQSNKSNSIELNPSDCVRLSSETELNRTQLNGFRSIGSGEPIQSKPKASPSKQVFLALFLLFIQ